MVTLSSLEFDPVDSKITFDRLVYNKFIARLSRFIHPWFGRLFSTITIGTLLNIYKLKKSILNNSSQFILVFSPKFLPINF